MKTSQSEIIFLFKDKYVKILKAFLDNPTDEFYVNELIQKTGVSPRILIAELKDLERKKLLVSKKRANAIFYSLNQNNVVTKRIKEMLK